MDRDTVERMETQVAQALAMACSEQLGFALLNLARQHVRTYQQWRPLPANTTPEEHDIITRIMVCVSVAKALANGASGVMAAQAEADALPENNATPEQAADAKVEAERAINVARTFLGNDTKH